MCKGLRHLNWGHCSSSLFKALRLKLRLKDNCRLLVAGKGKQELFYYYSVNVSNNKKNPSSSAYLIVAAQISLFFSVGLIFATVFQSRVK